MAAIAHEAIASFKAIALTDEGPVSRVGHRIPRPGDPHVEARFLPRRHLPVRARRTKQRPRRRPHQPRLVARAAQPVDPAPALREVQPDGRGLRLRPRVQEPRPRRRRQGPARADDRFAGLVAGRLGSLRRAVHPHGLAQRRHLPHRRRPRRRRHRQPALCAAQQLARQRQPRQGAPAAVADQAEVRPQALVGRPDGSGRQRRARVDGLQDLRLRRRPRRHLGARRGHQLGHRDEVAGLQRGAPQPLFGRARARQPAGRGADGPDLREPRRPGRPPRSGGLGPRRARDLRAHGDERRRNRGAGGGWPHLRQGPRRGRSQARRPRARRRGRRSAGPGLEERLRHRQGGTHHHQRHRRRLEAQPDDAGTTATSTCCSATNGS